MDDLEVHVPAIGWCNLIVRKLLKVYKKNTVSISIVSILGWDACIIMQQKMVETGAGSILCQFNHYFGITIHEAWV